NENYGFDDEPVEPCKIRPKSEEFENLTMNKDSDDKLPDSDSLKERFEEFLDMWVEIAAKEVEEINEKDDDDDNKMLSKIKDVIHPAINPAAKFQSGLVHIYIRSRYQYCP
ncbi:27362_t:CDS:2, partial [Racocetra persica]